MCANIFNKYTTVNLYVELRNYMMNKHDTRERFIQQYMTAVEANMTIDQFADYLGIQASSVTRYKNKIAQETGIKLPTMVKDNGGDEVEMPATLVGEDTYKKVSLENDPPKRIVITAAQNATPIHDEFFNSILQYCKIMDAELMVIPYRYKNPTSIYQSLQEKEEWWDKRLEPYLVEDDVTVHKELRVMGHVKMQPTATNPLSGFDSYTGRMSAIFGHPKIQLKTIPTPSKSLPKILSTTGAVTRENYTDTKAGRKGEFHHSLAAIIVEIDNDGVFHQRHIHADELDGSFYDLDSHFSVKGRSTGHRVAGLITGDSHAEFIDPAVKAATYTNNDSLCSVLRPLYSVVHDVEDFYRRNHHHRGDPFLAYGKHHLGRNNVEEGLQVTANFLDEISDDSRLTVVIKANHDEALDRWLREADPKYDPENARFYHYMMYNMFSNMKMTETGYSTVDPFVFWCHNPDQQQGLSKKDFVKFLKRDESFTIEGIEVGFHGDKGPNGGRGNIKAFTKIGPKTVIGHSHSPGIEEGVYQVGLSARMDLEYVSGPSSWLQTHCIIYPDGKRTLVNVVNGKWKR